MDCNREFDGILAAYYLLDSIGTKRLRCLGTQHGKELFVTDGLALSVGDELVIPNTFYRKVEKTFNHPTQDYVSPFRQYLCNTMCLYLDKKKEYCHLYKDAPYGERFKYATDKEISLNFSDFILVETAYDAASAFLSYYGDQYDFTYQSIEELAACLAIEMYKNLKKQESVTYSQIDNMVSSPTGRYQFKENFSAVEFMENIFRDIEGVEEIDYEDEENWE